MERNFLKIRGPAASRPFLYNHYGFQKQSSIGMADALARQSAT
jgi:hypothetical protein